MSTVPSSKLTCPPNIIRPPNRARLEIISDSTACTGTPAACAATAARTAFANLYTHNKTGDARQIRFYQDEGTITWQVFEEKDPKGVEREESSIRIGYEEKCLSLDVCSTIQEKVALLNVAIKEESKSFEFIYSWNSEISRIYIILSRIFCLTNFPEVFKNI